MAELTTTINTKEAEWTGHIWSLWHAAFAGADHDPDLAVSANYFTPRPYRNEYDRGSDREGFVYVTRDRRVFQVDWKAGKDPVDLR